MKALKCDRCGKLYEYYIGSKSFPKTERANAMYLVDRDLERKHWERKSYDLCLDCMQELEIFLHKYEK